ncbi:uncharacterized protein LOC109819133 isoform X2 [Cajanus cajan]|uniref:uncharacterized protein LOC109819133 isoform X2 n=1 Tax=Cajanus cajan TaxID=3821 RepID=UPI00098DB6BD|nr:uncharacterized protein LOC109819133 isoform X2 [Cajanus cajan]
MGREWHFAGRFSKRSGVGSAEESETQAPSGCMCAVFQFFDFHPFHFHNINHQHQQSSFKPPSCTPEDHTTVSKGAEAPRNSLESEDGDGTISSLSSKEDFKIPNIIQIKTSGGTRTSGGNLNDLSSEISSSPGTKTPTLVARLMGLDLLPGAQSPSFSSSSSSSCVATPDTQGNVPHLQHLRHKQHVQTKHRNSIDSSDIAATRSLPDTPRISLARRSDVDHHHRLSLQIINKENMNLGEDFELPRLSLSKRKCDENHNGRSPSHYARQIVKQVKESVSRKVGQDITNTSLKTREEFVGQIRSKKSHKTSSLKSIDETETSHSNSSSYSPRLRFIEKHKPSTTTTTPSPLTPKDQNILKLPPPTPPQVNTQPQLPRVLTKPKPEQKEFQSNKSVPKCKRVTNEKFNSRLKRPPQTSDIIRNKQEEPFIIRPTSPSSRASDIKSTKTKKTHPLSSNLNNVPNVLPVKTDPSPPATKIPPKQSQQVFDTEREESKSSWSSQLSSCSRHHKYKQEQTITTTLATRDNNLNGVSASSTAVEQELHYITSILAVNPHPPLDPSIFHHLEHKDRNFAPNHHLGHRWNRRLLFDVVDEVLGEIVGPREGERRKRLWFWRKGKGGVEGLVERVWKRVGEFPRAKCEVLEDIDGLIEGEREMDIGEGMEEEGEGVVAEIEGNIWDTLLHETVMVVNCWPSVGNMEIQNKLLFSGELKCVYDLASFQYHI